MNKRLIPIVLSLVFIVLSGCSVTKSQTQSQVSSKQSSATADEQNKQKFNDYITIAKKVEAEYQADFSKEIPVFTEKTDGLKSFELYIKSGEAAAQKQLKSELEYRKMFVFDTYLSWRLAYPASTYTDNPDSMQTSSKTAVIAADSGEQCIEKIKKEFSVYYKGHEKELEEDMKIACDVFYGTASNSVAGKDNARLEVSGVNPYQFYFDAARQDMFQLTKYRGYLPSELSYYDAIEAGPVVRQ